MRVVRTAAEARAACAGLRRELGFVPTMGALHDGHLSLVRAAGERCAALAASVCVNPTQFGPDEDFAVYPRDEARDVALLEAAGVDVLFVPAAQEMYPEGQRTTVQVDPSLTGVFEGAGRPGHFDGVTTIVAKLLAIVCPDVLYLGEKDAQQLAVVRRMARDLDLPAEVVGVPTAREPDGLAMSSRNARLTPAERAVAPRLYAALRAAREHLAGGADCDAAVAAALHLLDSPGATRHAPDSIGRVAAAGPRFAVDYVAVVDPDDFIALPGHDTPRRGLVIAAARLGSVRLIDNVAFSRGDRRDTTHEERPAPALAD